MIIERMNESHISQIAALEAACFSAPWSVDCLRYELTNPLSLWLTAMDGEKVVGYVGSQTVMGESDMMNIAVHPDYRRQGIAQRLLDELIIQLKSAGSSCLLLEVRASNAFAIKLYEKNCFSQVGLRKNYYKNPKEDALILKRSFDKEVLK